ncbi:MAG: polymer-forming cytoskeletal protein [Gemmataceae bacterium]|nr:polymer-forming cytoskeletal protein [Gemmataceae bacterium]MCS7270037.1 polymer-forming cytoskeletal protein [Gemmataceae bacterium]MDW8242996.1 polymer-forming cytoskeletal protein [Thermogemmata sp.]
MTSPDAPLLACPGCGLPRLATDIGYHPCPVCADTTPPLPLNSPAPAPPPTDPRAALPADAAALQAAELTATHPAFPWRTAIAAFTAGTLVGGLTAVTVWPWSTSSPAVPESAQTDGNEGTSWSFPASVPVGSVSPLPAQNTPSAIPETTPFLPPPTPPSVPPPLPHQQPLPQVQPAVFPEPDLPGGKHPPILERLTFRIDQPEAVCTVPEEWLRPGCALVLHGRVGELRLPRIPPHFQLDARQLTARSITLSGPRIESARLHLAAPEGVVACRTDLGRDAYLCIDAPGGTVRFGAINPWQPSTLVIEQGAKVFVRARHVHIDGTVQGDRTHVQVECTPPARLRVHTVRLGAHVEYRKAPTPNDGPIDAHAITLDPSAVFRRHEP